MNWVWEQRKLNTISKKVTDKNTEMCFTQVLTNSAEFGIVPQNDFFDRDIAKKENLSGYYVVRNNDFVYNPRISVNAPVGPIRRNKLGKTGVMSPLYTVFRASKTDLAFLETYFKSQHWNLFMKQNGNSGARSDRFAIKDELFFEMPIPYPQESEQSKIGQFFSTLDSLITLHQRGTVYLII